MVLDAADLARRDWDDHVDETVRFAVVGLGGFARDVALPALVDADYCDPTVLVSGSPEPAEESADEWGARALDYGEYEAGAATDAYDAVYVATPNALHREHVTTAAEFGKGVVCEKPLADTTDAAEAIVETCRRADVALMTAYRMQLDPVVRHLRGAYADLVGEPVDLAGSFVNPALDGSRGPDQWRLDADLAGGGALFDLGVYPLNTARFLLGADPLAVTAETNGDGAFAEVDEHVAFQLVFPGGVTASFTAGFSGFGSARLSLDGTEGRLELGDAFQSRRARRLTVETDSARYEIDCPATDEVREEFDYFAHAMATGGDIEPDGADGLRDVRVMTAIYEAAETGRRVDVEYGE